jgi:hypothetical protein
MIHPRSLPLLLACSSAAFAGDAKSPVAAGGDWEFSLSAGPAWRHSGTIDFAGGSRSAGVAIPSFVGGNVLINPPIGAADTYDDRFYDDGFVRPDLSTEIDGLTGYWGYQNASQVNVGADSISFHATGFQSIRSDLRSLGQAPSAHSPERGIAPVIQFDARYKHEIAGIQPGFSVSLAWSPVDFDSDWSDFALSQTRDDFRHDWTDIYNLGGFGPLVPSAPHTGTLEGPGFLLENIPDSRGMVVVPIASENALIGNSVSTRFRADHTTLSFGPTIGRRLAPQWNLQAGVGVSLHWVNWSAKQEEQLAVTQNETRTVIGEWNESSSGNKILAGLYMQLAAEWTPVDYVWSLKALIRADIGQSFSQNIGPSRITYDTDGLTAAIMVSHPL